MTPTIVMRDFGTDADKVIDMITDPIPAVMAQWMGGVFRSQYWLYNAAPPPVELLTREPADSPIFRKA